jgi:hypothetical protein
MSDRTSFVSIWLFIGILLLIYGILICGTGIYEIFVPPAQQVAEAHLRPAIWWGGLLLVLGAFYCRRFAPSKKRKAGAKSEQH